jgi:hypothetical protein
VPVADPRQLAGAVLAELRELRKWVMVLVAITAASHGPQALAALAPAARAVGFP